MKKRTDKVDYFAKMFNAESEYRANTSGNNSYEPFMVPLLFRILSCLRLLIGIFAAIFGSLFVLLIESFIR